MLFFTLFGGCCDSFHWNLPPRPQVLQLMGPVQTLATILGLSTVSGINLYLTVFMVGLAQRLGWVHGLPSDLALLSHPLVLGASALLFLLEFLADKIPFVTPIWDGIHTFIRPVGGALLALGAAAQLNPVLQVLATLAGGTIALSTHGGKMGLRLLAHTAPEPATHSLLSLAEDLSVLALLALAWKHPMVALPVLGLILLATGLLLPLLARALLMVVTGLRETVRGWMRSQREPRAPVWVHLKALELTAGEPARIDPAFARRISGVPRFHLVYLVEAGTHRHLVFRRWFRTRHQEFPLGPIRIIPGFLWDSMVFWRNGKPQLLLAVRSHRQQREALQPGS